MLTQSCTKNNDGCYTPKDNYYYLTTAQLNQTPYFNNPAFDTISFTSNKGDTLTFVKTKTDTTWKKETGNIGSPDCCYDQNFYQAIHNTYITTKGNGSFDVSHRLPNSYSNSYLVIKFNNFTFFYDAIAIDDTSFPRYLGELIKDNKKFKNVIYTFNNYSDSLSAISYMNKDLGLFFIDDKLNNSQYIITK